MKYTIDVPKSWVDITGGLHLPIEKGWDANDFRIDTGIKLTPYTEPNCKDIEDKVWKFSGEIQKMTCEQIHEVFGITAQNYDYFCNEISYQEAKAKYEAWKKRKDEICVGDVIRNRTCHYINAVVTCIDDDGMATYIFGSGETGCCYDVESDWEKTGRHFDDIAELLKKIRED